jgi:hypothetical protein
MPRPNVPRQVVRGPYGGINLTADESLVPDSQFVDGVNVVNDDGTVAPRPGYTSVSFVSTSGSVLTGLTDCYGISLDLTNDRIYYIDDDTIKYCDLDGQNVTATSLSLAGAAYHAAAVAVNPGGAAGYQAFWSETDDGGNYVLYRANLDFDTNKTDISPANFWTDSNSSIRLDTANSKVYYTTYINAAAATGNFILRCDMLGGANETTIATVYSRGYGFGLNIGGANNREVYYYYDSDVYTCDADGGNDAVLIDDAFATLGIIPQEFRVYAAGPKVYYQSSSLNKVVSTGLDGSTPTDELTGIDADTSLEVDGAEQMIYGVNTALTTIARYSLAADVRIISGFHWERTIEDVDSADPNNDLYLLQAYDTAAAGTDNYFNAVFPARGESYSIWCRSDENSGSESFIVTDDRDTDPSTGDTILTGSGRATYTYTGYGLDTLKGGVVIAAGEQPYHFNHMTPWVAGRPLEMYIYINPSVDGGNWVLEDATSNTGNIAWNADAATFDTALDTLDSITDGTITVTKVTSGKNPYWKVVFDSTYTPDSAAFAITVKSTTALTDGGNPLPNPEGISLVRIPRWPDGLMMLIPLGLPKAPTPTVSKRGAGSGPNGDYTYRVAWYSSSLNMEGPASDASSEVDPAGEDVYVIVTIPDTVYFGSWASSTGLLSPGLIDHIRIYRKRTSSSNHWDTWYLVDEVPLDFGVLDSSAGGPYYDPAGATLPTARDYRFVDDYTDDTVYASFQAMPNIQHPPNDAQYVEMHGSRLFIIGRDGTVWYSDVGGIASGELGHAYFPNANYFTLQRVSASDEPPTGIKAWGGSLYIWTKDRVFSAAIADDEFPYVRPIPGAPGCASHWTIVESPAMPDATGYVLYGNPRGIYAFDGQQAVRVVSFDNLGVVETSNHDVTTRPTYLDYWYYATAALDPYNNAMVFTTFEDQGSSENTPLTLHFAFLTKAWFKWTLNGTGTTAPHLWLPGREWTSGTGENRPILLFSDSDGNLFKLDDDGNDNGGSFDWYWKTGLWDMGDPTLNKPFGEFTTLWNDGALTLTLDAWINGETSVTQQTTTLSTTQRLAQIRLQETGRSVQLKVAGTVEDSSGTLDRPRLVATVLSQRAGASNVRG